MPMLAMAIYGSSARGDARPDSDVDLLGVIKSGRISTKAQAHINLAIYPSSYLVRKAQQGDLFLLHLVTESKPLYDSIDFWSKLKAEFRYKSDYTVDATVAAQLGMALLLISPSLEKAAFFNKRVAWVARTILIARCAQERKPTFAAKSLVDAAKAPWVMALIDIKSRSEVDYEILPLLKRFILEFVPESARGPIAPNLDDAIARIEASGNSIASQALIKLGVYEPKIEEYFG